MDRLVKIVGPGYALVAKQGKYIGRRDGVFSVGYDPTLIGKGESLPETAQRGFSIIFQRVAGRDSRSGVFEEVANRYMAELGAKYLRSVKVFPQRTPAANPKDALSTDSSVQSLVWGS